jgi:diguanylate cyclase (GGDEF)-like protein
MGGASARLAVLRGLFAAREDPYAGADLGNAKRLGSTMWLIGAVIAAVLLPFAPPTAALGNPGWAIACILVAISLVGIHRVRSEAAGFDDLLVFVYATAAQIALTQWLAGGWSAPYDQLFLLSFIFAAAVHPPRRTVWCLGAASLAFLAPLAYDGFDATAFVGGLTQLFLWWGLALITMMLMTGVRAQRLAGEAASREARIDQLTGLGNRRAFEEAIGRETARESGRLALVLIDVNSFKSINDRHGHPAGDECLRRVAEVLRLTVRAPDHCYRWGGDEFAVILPDAGERAAEDIRDRLTATLDAARVGPDDTPLTVGCGVASATCPASAEQLMADADMALLLAKRADGAAAA